ncbi:glycosyl hydrolase family 18 protein [Aquimarina sp. M1]
MNIRKKDTKNSSDTISFISQRHIHNQKFEALNLKTEAQWDSLNNISGKKVRHKKGKVHPNTRTFGWHLFSNGSSYKNYNFSMLWGLSYFSYSIQPETGSYKNIHQWKTTALIDSAKAKNCKVFFSVSNFGKKNNSIFLENKHAQKTLIDSLINLLALRSADGINIDFEGVSKKNKDDFTRFILRISKSLKQENPNLMVSLCLYAIDWNDIFDIKAIDPYIDFYTLMGYDYYGSFSKTTGPVTPFKKSKKFGKGLETSVNYYNKKGVRSSKLIVGLPYYGAEWYTKSPEMGAKVTKFKSHSLYKSIKKIYVDSLKVPLQFDTVSSSTYIVINDLDKNYKQIFFEDVQSLSIKYDWIKNKEIGGVGIWALGYDDGHTELWDLLTNKFSEE